MDELELVQEAVANWESLDEVEEIGTREIYLENTEERAFLSRIQLRDMRRPVYIEVRICKEEDEEDEGVLEDLFEHGLTIVWKSPTQ